MAKKQTITAEATTRGRRFTRRTTEILCKLSREEARSLRLREVIEVTEEQALLLEQNDLATITRPKPTPAPKKKETKTESATTRTPE